MVIHELTTCRLALAHADLAGMVTSVNPRGNLADRVYLERGRPVRIVTSWGPGGGPRNVEIEREDGTRVVRPFRGLRRTP